MGVELNSYQEPLIFNYSPWSKTRTNQNDVKFVFDKNTAEIGIKMDASGKLSPVFASKSVRYNEFMLVGYGVAKRGNTWKGGRVRYEQDN